MHGVTEMDEEQPSALGTRAVATWSPVGVGSPHGEAPPVLLRAMPPVTGYSWSSNDALTANPLRSRAVQVGVASLLLFGAYAYANSGSCSSNDRDDPNAARSCSSSGGHGGGGYHSSRSTVAFGGFGESSLGHWGGS
jgi:hypothetical protein